MASAKRPARKTTTGAKHRSAAPKKPRSAKSESRRAARKPAATKAKSKPAGKRSAPAVKAAPKAAKTSRAAQLKSVKPAKAPKAAKAGITPSRPSVDRAVPPSKPPAAAGPANPPLRKAPPPSRAALRRALEPSDPNAFIHGFRPYQPKAGEAYMSPGQLAHFLQILQAWKRELMEEVDRTVHHMQDEASNFPDPNDRATQESEFGLELRTRDRERKLLKKIDAAIERIEDRSYGFCEETGEEIGLRRLEARPVATLSVEAQERREMAERQYGERDDRYR
jgi:DnaK suppressor protein